MKARLAPFLRGLLLTLIGAAVPLWTWVWAGRPVTEADWVACVFVHVVSAVFAAFGGGLIKKSREG